MKKLLILSGKGGTGKTTTAAAFVRFAQARAVADCDVDAPNLHLVMGQAAKSTSEAFMGSEKAVADADACTGCGECARLCRFEAAKMEDGRCRINEYACEGCGVCARACPAGAISLQPDCGECARLCRFEAAKMEDGRCRINEYACEGCGVCARACPAGAISLQPDIAGTRELFTGENGVFSTATLKMGRGNSGKLVTEVKNAMEAAAPATDLAIIDGSPGIGCPVIASMNGVDLVLVVAEPSRSGRSDLERLVRTARTFRTDIAVCVNKWPVIASMNGVDLVLVVAEPSRSGRSDLERLVRTARTFRTDIAVCVNKWDASPENAFAIRSWCEEENIAFAGMIPYDKSASKAANAGKSIADIDCPARNALSEIFGAVCAMLEMKGA